MKRRTLLTAGLAFGVSGRVPAWAQSTSQQRRLGVLDNHAEKDLRAQEVKATIEGALKDLGWLVGRNLQIDYRWGGSDTPRYGKYAQEILALAPDAILIGGGTNITRVVQQATSTVPIVFVAATDPVGGGLVASLARPGGNITGLSQRDFDLGAKSLELLKQLAPDIRRVAVGRDPTTTGGTGQLGAIQAVAPSFRVEIVPIDVRTPAAIEQGLASFSRGSQGGLLVTTSSAAQTHRKVIIRLAEQHRLPAIYPYSFFVNEGALCSYGVDHLAAYRAAAGYVDRIFKGEKPADMPVQQPTKFELLVNLKAARAIGLRVPQALLLRADKVIE